MMLLLGLLIYAVIGLVACEIYFYKKTNNTKRPMVKLMAMKMAPTSVMSDLFHTVVVELGFAFKAATSVGIVVYLIGLSLFRVLLYPLIWPVILIFVPLHIRQLEKNWENKNG